MGKEHGSEQQHPKSHKEALKTLPISEFANYIDVPIYRAVNYFFEDMKQVHEYHRGTFRRARYGRYDNLTCEHAQQLIAGLEDCESSLLFSSGMSALTTAILALCSKGDHIIFGSNCYLNISRLCKELLPRFGVKTTGISTLRDDFVNTLTRAIKKKTKMVIVETPSNPHMQMVDIASLKQTLATFPNIILIVDSTFASPYNFQPSRYGADLVLQSCTKYLSGGANVMAGSISGSKELIEKIRLTRNTIGGIISPEDAYLLTQGIYTLTPRMEYYNRVGLEMAKFLDGHPKIKKVYYTGLPSHAQYKLAKNILKGHGGVVTFEVAASTNAVTKFIESVKIPFIATHFGSPFTTIEQYGIFTLYHMTRAEKAAIGVNDQMVRMSIGFDDFNLLRKDIEHALEGI
jgi:cystathionine gamma-synthase